MKIIASISKSESVRFISHLDVQRMLQRTIRRASIPVAFSQGFNPHPLISFATALAVGQTGDGEWIEIRLEQDMNIADFTAKMNANFPHGFAITNAFVAKEGSPSIATLMVSAQYTVQTMEPIEKDALQKAIDELMSGEIIVTKHKKQGGRKVYDAEVDIRPMVNELTIAELTPIKTVLHIKGRQDASGGLNTDLLLHALNAKLNIDAPWRIHRSSIDLKDFC